MNANGNEDNIPPSPALDVAESPRKRMRLESSARKSWSLMDRRPDTDVLQEMGVSPLDPDDGDSHSDNATNNSHKPNLKRKHDIENVNPNINTAVSPRGCKLSPRPGPSRKSPRGTDKLKPLQPSEHTLDTNTSYQIEEETPLGQSISAHYKPGLGQAECGQKQDICTRVLGSSPTKSEVAGGEVVAGGEGPGAADSFSRLSDEVVLGVLRWLPKRTLAHCMLVCKRWYRLACDETLWQRLDLGNKTLSKDAVGKILARKPVIVRLASSEIGEWHPTSPVTPSRIQYLDLSMCALDHSTLENLIRNCPALRKLSLESVKLSETAEKLIGKCTNLETLNLTMAQGITDKGLTAILDGCTSLQSLNISWCNLTEASLKVLVAKLPQKLQRLNIGGARIMTDEMVGQLVARCPRLLELDLSDCSRLTVDALLALLPLSRMEHLALSRCYLLPPHALTKLSSMSALQYVEVWGMLPATSLSALRAALPAIQINQFMFSAIARPTVGTRRTSIWGLRTRD